MVSDGENENLYTTRISGQLSEDLDVYIENSEGTKSERLRHLLDLGLQVEGAERPPGELQEEVDGLREAADRLREALLDVEEQRRRASRDLQHYRTAGAFMLSGVLGFFILLGVGLRVRELIGPYPDIIDSTLIMLFGIAFFAGMMTWFTTRLEDRYNSLADWLKSTARAIRTKSEGSPPGGEATDGE